LGLNGPEPVCAGRLAVVRATWCNEGARSWRRLPWLAPLQLARASPQSPAPAERAVWQGQQRAARALAQGYKAQPGPAQPGLAAWLALEAWDPLAKAVPEQSR